MPFGRLYKNIFANQSSKVEESFKIIKYIFACDLWKILKQEGRKEGREEVFLGFQILSVLQ